MLRTHRTAYQLDIFDPFLPEELKGLPAELAAVDLGADWPPGPSEVTSNASIHAAEAPLSGVPGPFRVCVGGE